MQEGYMPPVDTIPLGIKGGLRRLAFWLWSGSIFALVLPFVWPQLCPQAVEISLHLLWLELIITGCVWCFFEDNWPALVAAGWLLACTLGVWLPFKGTLFFAQSPPSFTSFVWMLLLGYSSLRLGLACASRITFLQIALAKLCRVLSPEIIAPRTYKYSLYGISVLSIAAILGFYIYFETIPLFADDPALARYQHFNGPYTHNLARFYYRIFSSLSLVSSFFIVSLYAKNLTTKEKVFAYTTVMLSLGCMLGSGSRGDAAALSLFIAIIAIFSLQGRRRLFVGGILSLFFGIVFCLLTYYRNKSGLVSFAVIFPEIGDAVLLTNAADKHNVPWAWGKTYASAILSFIPSSLCPFRMTYGFGRYSLEILHMGSNTPIAPSYGGLRPTFVGEAYLNGGIPGILIFGFLLGTLLGTWRSLQKKITPESGACVLFFTLSLFTVMVSDFYGLLHGLALLMVLVWLSERIFTR